MGNGPSGNKRRCSNEEIGINKDILSISQIGPICNHSAKMKLIVQPTQDIYEIDAISKILSEADLSDIETKFRKLESNPFISLYSIDSDSKTIPTVFKWQDGGKDVFLSGSFNHWKAKIPMVKSKHNFYTIVDLPKGDHQYKFIIDGVWKIDYKQHIVNNDNGSQNNVISVKSSDFDVLEALKDDIANSNSVRQNCLTNVSVKFPDTNDINKPKGGERDDLVKTSPLGSYNQELPEKDVLFENNNDKSPTPPLLPPHLLQVILNKETSIHCDPNILPHPNHVMINHMYALSIKDSIIVLSAIVRYRQKFVSTVMYKPI